MPAMTLDNLISGKLIKPSRTVIYGVEGVGKSSFAACAPAPVFIGAEDGTGQLDVTRFPQPDGWGDIMQAITTLYQEQHQFKTLVIDSADWAEKLAFAAVAAENGQSSIEGLGYGKGYVMGAEKFRSLLMGLDALHHQGMNVVVIAHSRIAPFADPAGDTYDHYTLSTDKRITPMLKEWADAVLFADFDKSLKSVGEGFNRRTIGKSYGERIMFTEHRASHDAKNRYNLPTKMPLSWAEYQAAIDLFYSK